MFIIFHTCSSSSRPSSSSFETNLGPRSSRIFRRPKPVLGIPFPLKGSFVCRRCGKGDAFHRYLRSRPVHGASFPLKGSFVFQRCGKDCTFLPFEELRSVSSVLGVPFPLKGSFVCQRCGKGDTSHHLHRSPRPGNLRANVRSSRPPIFPVFYLSLDRVSFGFLRLVESVVDLDPSPGRGKACSIVPRQIHPRSI